MAGYKVQRAIFLAAGKGSRMAPVTDRLPKPLVTVQGKRIISTLLDAVVQAGIPEIYVVRGYLSEKFDVLQREYPQIQFIENPDYAAANNLSSIVCAGDFIENAYILEGDLLLHNRSLITPVQEYSNYLAIPVERTDDWCFFPDKKGVIRRMAVGGENCQQMVGISYWTTEDGRRLTERAKELYKNPVNRQLYWDEVALSRYLPEFSIRTRTCCREDVIEIDTLEELQALDCSYVSYEVKR